MTALQAISTSLHAAKSRADVNFAFAERVPIARQTRRGPAIARSSALFHPRERNDILTLVLHALFLTRYYAKRARGPSASRQSTVAYVRVEDLGSERVRYIRALRVIRVLRLDKTQDILGEKKEY